MASTGNRAFFVVSAIAGIAGAIGFIPPATAQPIIPANDGTNTIVQPDGNRFDITGGQRSGDGANLFHSFTEFGLNSGQIANFLSRPDILNILARISGGNVSYINGLIQITGGNSNLFLMNPSGIVFGANASLNVPAAFTATTANGIGFNNNWFNAVGTNNYANLVGTPNAFAFTSSQPAAIANLGELAVGAGQDLSLLAGSIENSGKLSAPGGNITIAAVPGENIVRISQTGFALSLEVATKDNSPSAITNPQSIISNPVNLPQMLTGGNLGSATQAVKNPDGTITLTGSNGQIYNQGQLSTSGSDKGGQINVMGRLGYNLGQIIADGDKGGNIQIEINNLLDAGTLSAKGTSGEGGNIAVNYTGRVIQTTSANTTVNSETQAGTIEFKGGADTVFTSSGNLTATGEKGGTVRIFGENVRLLASNIDASGKNGGGEILVGGDFQGRTQGAGNAQNTLINHASNLTANAQTQGNGGRVIVWSDKQTTFAGNVTAQGGTVSGNGGFVEVSGKENLTMSGTVNVGAFNGLAGTLLLDPKNIVIDDTTGGFPSFDLVDPNPSGSGSFMQIVPLSTGNIVVAKPYDNFGGSNAGAVYLYNGNTGALISTLTGSTANDQVGSSGVTALTNGNYVVSSRYWNNGATTQAGAVTWGNGSTGITGSVSAANSLVGTTTGDQVGLGGVTALTNGNYVVSSYDWNNGVPSNSVGAVTWGNGSTGITGAVSTSNSLYGTTTNDWVGIGGVTALTNGNYVVSSRYWNNGAVTGAGAVTWGNGSTGITGAVSTSNSLYGTTTNDWVGIGGVIALTNGNYVVNSYDWNNGVPSNFVGAVTWGNGSTGITGAVSISNSLHGSTTDDRVGNGGVTALTNGNYVVNSYEWDNGAATNAGAVTWGNGSTGITGAVSAANSLVGTTNNDSVGNNGVTALTNGNYVVRSYYWSNGVPGNSVGAVTWGNGSTGISGAVSTANSLIGTTTFDQVGYGGVTALTNGNYVVSSPSWNNGVPGNSVGAVTWGNGSTGISGAVSTANSLYGTTTNDQVGLGTVTALTNGNYVVNSPYWDNGAVADAGAATWVNGSTGQTLDGTNIVSRENSIIGQTANAGLAKAVADNVNSTFLVPFTAGTGRVAVGFDNPTPSLLTFNRGQNSTITFTTNFLRQTLDTGTAVVLQANNDITLNSPITTNNPTGNGGDLTLQAGRSIILNTGANITTDNGNLTLTANDTAANGVVDAERSAGQAVITIAPGVTIDSGTGNTLITLSTGAGLTNNTSGDMTLAGNINAANLRVENQGPNNGAIIIPNTATINLTGDLQQLLNSNTPIKLGSNITSTGGNIIFSGPLTLTANATLDTSAGNGAISLNNTVDSTSGENITLNTGSGDITFSQAVGNITPLGNIIANSSGTTNFNSTVKAATITTDAGGATKINGDVTTTSDQTYNDILQIEQDIVLNSSAGKISFGNAVEGGVGGENLTVTTGGGNITFNGAVGSSTLVGAVAVNSSGVTSFNSTVNANSVTTDASGTTKINGDINTTGDQTYNDIVTLNNSVSLTTTSNGNITFGNTIDGTTAGTENLTLNTGSGNITFSKAVGNTTSLGNIIANSTGTTNFSNTVNAATITTDASGTTKIGGDITTTGAQTYNDPIILTNSAILTNNNNNFTFATTINGTNGTENLTLNAGTGDITFSNAVGNTTSLGNIIANSSGITNFNNTVKAATITTDASGTTKINGDITTTGDQTYNDIVNLTNTVALTTTSNGNIIFNNSIDGTTANTENLTLSTGTGNITFGGNVGNTIPFGNIIANSSGITNFNSTVKATTINTDASGTTKINGDITTTGDQTYNDIVNLTNSVALTTTSNGNLTFGNTIDGTSAGTENLSITTASGDITLKAAVGSATKLGNLTINNSGILNIADAADINLEGAFNQIGSGAVNTAGDITTSNDDIRFSSPVTLTGNVLFNPGTATIGFGSTLAASNYPLTFRAGEIDFSGAVTGTNTVVLESATPEQNIVLGGTTDSSTTTLDLTATDINSLQPGFTNITIGRADGYGAITSAGDVTFNSPVTIQSPASGGSINTTGFTINGANNSTINLLANQDIKIGDIINPGRAINITSNNGSIDTSAGKLDTSNSGGAGGAIALTSPSQITISDLNSTGYTNTGNITLTSKQINLNGAPDAVKGKGDILLQTFTDTENLDLRFQNQNVLADGFNSITIGRNNGSGIISLNSAFTFSDPVTIQSPNGSIVVYAPLVGKDNASITLTGKTNLMGDITTANQNIIINGNIALGNNVTLSTSSDGNGNIAIYGLIDGDKNLTLDAGTGGIFLNGDVGTTTRLGNLTFNSASNVQADAITAASITQKDGTGTTTFGGEINTNSEGINLKGNNFTFSSPVTTTEKGGVNINNSGKLDIATKAEFNLAGEFNQTGAGEVAISSNITTDNKDIKFSGPVTLNGEINFNLGNATLAFGSTLTAGDNPVTLTASEIDFGGEVTGTNQLVLQPATAGQNINVGATDNNTDALDLTVDEINFLQKGFAAITIGRADSSGAINIENNVNFKSPITIQSPETGGSITATGEITADAVAVELKADSNIVTNDILSSGGNITLASKTGEINTSAGTIDASSSNGDGGAVRIDAAGNITTNNIISSAQSPTGKAGAIDLTSGGAIDTKAGTLNSSVRFVEIWVIPEPKR